MKIKAIGCDPEFFISNGYEFISAHDILPGTKRRPFALDKGSVQVDGTAGEFGIDPATTPEEFDKNISTVLTQIQEMLTKVNPELQIHHTPIVTYDDVYFAELPHKVKELGCEPDFDSDGNMKTPGDELMQTPTRTAAGHLHFSWTDPIENPFDKEHFKTCLNFSKAFLKEKYFAPRTPAEHARIKYYGVPGSFRPKRYGVELRGPSNMWVARSKTRKEIFELAYKKAMEL